MLSIYSFEVVVEIITLIAFVLQEVGMLLL
jgi:hypothetical protein